MTDSVPLATLADIELPAPPDWRPLIGLAAAILLLAVAAVVLYIRQQKRRKTSSIPATAEQGHLSRSGTSREALARLEHLQLEWSSGAIDARAAAYRLGTLLRLGLGLPQLHPSPPPSGLDACEWQETLALLQDLRYTPAPTRALTRETFARAQRWLSQDKSRNGAQDV